MRHLILSLAGLSLFVSPLAIAQTIFIKDAKVVTGSNQGTLDKANIIIRDGRIQQIGPNAAQPENTDTVVAGPQIWVTPGLFAPLSQIGLVEVGAEKTTNDTRAGGAATSVSDMAVDSFNAMSPVIDNTRIEGITHTAIAASASHNLFGGTGAVINTTGEFDSVESDNAFIYVQLGQRGAGIAGGSRSAALSQLRAALGDALAYPSRYDGPTDGDSLPRRDAAALAKAARGAMPIVIGADRAADLLRIIDLKETYRLDVIIAGAAEGWMVADQLKAANIKVIIDPLENLPGSFDRVGSSFDNAAKLDAAGVDFAIFTRSAGLSHNIRVLPQHAGNAVAHGLSWDAAFAAISTEPASWFGIESALTRGGDTLVVWDGDPLEVTSSPHWIMIDGDVQSLKSRQTELRDRYNPLTNDTKPHKYR